MAKITEQYQAVLAAVGLTESQLAVKANLDTAIAYVIGTRGLEHKTALKRMIRSKAEEAIKARGRQRVQLAQVPA